MNKRNEVLYATEMMDEEFIQQPLILRRHSPASDSIGDASLRVPGF